MSEPGTRPSYRLSVVWFTDLVGYSGLAARDQNQAFALVQRFQRAVETAVPSGHGRVVKFIGDAALLESPSAEAALQAATALHAEWAEGLRTGIHLGDVAVAADGDLYGDGVNVALRIQTEAEPGQIVVSEDVWRRFRSRPDFVFESLGERALKGVEPMELFRVVAVETREPFETCRAPKANGVVRPLGQPSVAVLPFANMSSDAENEYFSDGMTEEILMLLARIEGLKVISRTSVMQYKGTVKPIRQIGEELGVTTILEGSVRHAGRRVRITAQLIDAATDEHLWADRYDRDLEDIFAIQSDVAERIAKSLRFQLTSRERARLAQRPTENIEAYELYLKGQHFLNRRTGESLKQAIEFFEGAVHADAGFAEASAGLSAALCVLPGYAEIPASNVIEKARSAAEMALSLDPRVAEAHFSLGRIAQWEWKWEEAERRYDRGLELSPGSVTGYFSYGSFLSIRGRLDDGIAKLKRALELDPLSLLVHTWLGIALLAAGRADEALEIYRRALQLDPGFAQIYNSLSILYLSQGRFQEALTAMAERDRLDPHYFPSGVTNEARAAYAVEGGRGFWEATLHGLAGRIGQLGSWVHIDMAEAYAQLGRTDEAFAHLEQLFETHDPMARMIPTSVLLEPLRTDPRFDGLMRQLGLD